MDYSQDLLNNKTRHPFSNNAHFTIRLQIAVRRTIELCTEEQFSISAEEEESYYPYRPNTRELSELIEYYLLEDDGWNKDPEVAKFMANLVAKIISGRTYRNIDLQVELLRLFNRLRHDKASRQFKKSKIFSSRLREAVERALKNCAENNATSSTQASTSTTTTVSTTTDFDQEEKTANCKKDERRHLWKNRETFSKDSHKDGMDDKSNGPQKKPRMDNYYGYMIKHNGFSSEDASVFLEVLGSMLNPSGLLQKSRFW